jgi:hypothetical protein
MASASHARDGERAEKDQRIARRYKIDVLSIAAAVAFGLESGLTRARSMLTADAAT